MQKNTVYKINLKASPLEMYVANASVRTYPIIQVNTKWNYREVVTTYKTEQMTRGKNS